MICGYPIVAVCASKIYEDTFREFLQGFYDLMTEENWRVFVYATDSDLYWKTRTDKGSATVFDLIDYKRIDALIIFNDKLYDTEVVDHIIEEGKAAGVPVVLLGEMREGCYGVEFDYQEGFAQMVRHLIEEHGIHRFHYMSGMRNNDFSAERESIFRRTLAEYHIPFDDSQLSYGDFWSVPAAKATEELLARGGELPEAIVCANDSMAISVLNTLASHGIHAPNDILITGFDGIDEINYTVPKITSCYCDYHEIAMAVTSILVRLRAGEKVSPMTPVLPRKILSESCGCKPHTPIDSSALVQSVNDALNEFHGNERFLNELAAEMIGCRNIDEIISKIDPKYFYNIVCLVKKNFMDYSLNPNETHTATAFGEKMYIVFDDIREDQNEGRDINIDEIVPRLDFLLEDTQADLRAILVFSALHYLEIPIGYVCFYYHSIERNNMLRVGQYTAALSNGLGGYRNARYQNHLREMVEDMYKFDSLTGLYNRNGFLRKYQTMVTENPPAITSFILCDLDGLKNINDTYSHHEGDNAIFVVAEALHAAVAKYRGICARYGGDEMIAVIPDACNVDEIKADIRCHLDAYNARSNKPYEVSASVGICLSSDSTDFETLFSRADELMYAEKKHKKNRRQ